MTTRQRAGNLLLIFACVAASASFVPLRALAQEVETSPETIQVASKFDEFTRVGGCDHSARLDNFAIMLQQNPDLVGYVIAYGPEGDGSGSGNFRLRISKDYLLNSRGIEAERVRTIYGGRYKNLEESASELWLAPKWAEAPQPMKYENKAAEFRGKFIEGEAWDGLFYGEEGTGPPIGDVSLANFADIARLQPESRAYIVVYNDEKSTPGAWRRIAARERNSLQTDYGIKSDRIKVIFGGYEKKAKVQFWILPADAPPPVKEVEDERTLMKPTHFGTFVPYQLKDKDHQQWILKGVAEELRHDKDMRACIIIRSEFLGAKEEEADEVEQDNEEEAVAAEPLSEQIVVPDEVPDVDPMQLVEKWKEDLLKEYGISENRLVLLVAPARDEYEVGEMEAWIVPKGAELPDPSAAEEVEEEPPVDDEKTPKSQP